MRARSGPRMNGEFYRSAGGGATVASHFSKVARSSPFKRRRAPVECEERTFGSSKGSRAYIRPPGLWHGAHLVARIGRTVVKKSSSGAGAAGAGSGAGVETIFGGTMAVGFDSAVIRSSR